MKIIGIDVGTTMIKGQLIDQKGSIKCTSERPSPTYTNNGVAYLSTTKSQEAVFSIIKDLAAASDEDVSAIAFSSIGESFSCVDKDGKSINDFILFVSDLGEEECQELRNKLGNEKVARTAGAITNRMYSFSKLMWLKKKHPEIYNKTNKFLMVAGYMVYRLTGKLTCDYTLAARTLCFDVKNKAWSKEIIDACGLDLSIFPELREADSIVGTVTKEVAKELGLSEKCVVLASAHDQVMAAIGSGLHKAGMANDGIGTAECLTISFDKIPTNYDFYKNNFCVIPFFVNNLYLTYAFTSTAGALLKWHRDYLGPLENKEDEAKGLDYYVDYSSRNVQIPTSLLVLPHFGGSGTPYLDGNSTGAILGLNQRTTKDEIYFALMEGASYEIKLCAQLCKKCGVKTTSISVNGGGAKSPSWLNIKANVLKHNLKTLTSPEGGIFGCFMCCMKALNPEVSYEELIKRFIKTKKIIKYDANLSNLYAQKFVNYKKIYPFTKKLLG